MNRKNTLTIYQEGNKFVLRRVVEDVLDSEEMIRTLAQMKEQKFNLEKQLIDFKADLGTMEKVESSAKNIRLKEVEDAKKEREEAMSTDTTKTIPGVLKQEPSKNQ